MDWIRRNWPDLLIGLALLAVIAGIIATLLNGGSFLSGGSRTPASPPAASATPQADTPADTGAGVADATTGNLAPQSGTQDTPQGTAQGPTPDTTPDAAAQDTVVPSIETTSLDGTDSTPDTGDAGVPVIPSSGDASLADPAATAPPTSAEVTAPVAPAPTTTGSSTTGSSATVSTASDAESSYRILIDSFGDADNALRRAQTFEEAGFPTFTAVQGALTLVLVGPFATQGEAESAFGRIQSEGLKDNPLLFEPDTAGEAAVSAAATSGEEAAPTPSASAAADTSQADTSLDTSGGERYVQAGAFNSSELARPQREQLESLGFNVSEVTEGSFVKLLVGPFGPDELASAQSRLGAQGIDYFVRSN